MDELLPFGRPSKIIGIGSNYRKHALEMGRPLPKVPKMFLIAPSALALPGQHIELPDASDRVDHEAELCVVIGRRASRVRVEDALDYVHGYTCANDITARDLQRADKVFARAKGFDTFCPIGPRIVQDLDPSDLRVVCRIDGEIVQDGRTSDMVFGVPELIAFASDVMTLEPGDLICTGTPAGVSPLAPGMTVEVEIEGIGVLSNPVRRRA